VAISENFSLLFKLKKLLCGGIIASQILTILTVKTAQNHGVLHLNISTTKARIKILIKYLDSTH